MTTILTPDDCDRFDATAQKFREDLEAKGGRGFVLGIGVRKKLFAMEPGYDVSITRSMSSVTTRAEAEAYLDALQREMDRVKTLLVMQNA